MGGDDDLPVGLVGKLQQRLNQHHLVVRMLEGLRLFDGVDDIALGAHYCLFRFGAEEVEQDQAAHAAAALVDGDAVLTIEGEAETPLGFFLEARGQLIGQLGGHFSQFVEGAGGDIQHAGFDLLLQRADLILQCSLSFLDRLLQRVLGLGVAITAFTIRLEQGEGGQLSLDLFPDGFAVGRKSFADVEQRLLTGDGLCCRTDSLPPL
ncbi:hypothetical protein D9M69_530300 [compost metagenome]